MSNNVFHKLNFWLLRLKYISNSISKQSTPNNLECLMTKISYECEDLYESDELLRVQNKQYSMYIVSQLPIIYYSNQILHTNVNHFHDISLQIELN